MRCIEVFLVGRKNGWLAGREYSRDLARRSGPFCLGMTSTVNSVLIREYLEYIPLIAMN